MHQAVFLQDGYASHLNVLKSPNSTGSRQASGNARLILKKFTFNNHQQQSETAAEKSNTLSNNGGNASGTSNPNASSTIASFNSNYNTISSVDAHDFLLNSNSMTNSEEIHNSYNVKSVLLAGGKLKK